MHLLLEDEVGIKKDGWDDKVDGRGVALDGWDDEVDGRGVAVDSWDDLVDGRDDKVEDQSLTVQTIEMSQYTDSVTN